MSYQLYHVRDAEAILKEKKLLTHLTDTLKEIDQSVQGRTYKGTTLKSTLELMGWRDQPSSLSILEGRRYAYKGLYKRVALEANLINYEDILNCLFRLQVGFDRGLLDTGVVLLNSQRSEKSPLGSSFELAKQDVEKLYPTISLPVTIVLFDLAPASVIENVITQTPEPKTETKPEPKSKSAIDHITPTTLITTLKNNKKNKKEKMYHDKINQVA